MENLFMQIFERRDWVVSQMRQQADSHAESIAFTLLAAGHRPPPWLFPSCTDQQRDLNGKSVVSELIFPGSQITTPATNRTVFQPPILRNTSHRTIQVPNGYTCMETVRATLDTNQHEEPEQNRPPDNQELAEPIAEVNIFSMVQRSRSRQKNIEDRLREKNQAANSGRSDGMHDRMQRSILATAGSNRTNTSLCSKPNVDCANNAGATTLSPGQQNGFHVNQVTSTESLKCSIYGNLENQGVHLDCPQSLVLENQISSSGNNVKVPDNYSVRNLPGVQVTDSVCHPLPETYLSVEPKKLEFDGVESVCMNPSSVQTMQQTGNTSETSDPDPAEAQPLNEDPSSTGCSLGRSLLDGVKSGYLNPDSAPVKQHPKSALKCASLDLPVMHSQKEDLHPTSSSEVPNPLSRSLLQKHSWCISTRSSVEGPCSKINSPIGKEKLNNVETKCSERFCSAVRQLVETNTSHTVEDTERTGILDGSSDQMVTLNSKPLEQQDSDSHVLHLPYSRSLQLTQLADTSSGDPASSGILPDSLLKDEEREDILLSLIHDANMQCVQVRSVACPEQLQPHAVTSGDVFQPSVSQGDTTHSNGCPPVTNTSVSEGNELNQDQDLPTRLSLQFNRDFADVGTPLDHPAPGTVNETLNEKSENYAVNCHLRNLGDMKVNFSGLTEACDISVRGKKEESAVTEVVSIGARKNSKGNRTERNNTTSAEKCTGNVQQDGTEHNISRFENVVQINDDSCTPGNDKPKKSSRPSVEYFLRSTSSHEKINLLQLGKSSSACGQKRPVEDEVQVNVGLSSKRRRKMCQSDANLSMTPSTDSASLSHQVGIAGHMLTVANFSQKSQPSDHCLKTSGSCESMSLESAGMNDGSNCKKSGASDIENGNSSRGRRNITSLSNVVLHNNPNASSRRNSIEEMVFQNYQGQKQTNLEVRFSATTAALSSCSGTLSDSEANCTQEEYTCLERQDLNVTNASASDEDIVLQMDNMPSQNVILNPENYSGTDSTVYPSCALAQHGEHASAPNTLVHGKLYYDSNVELMKYKGYNLKGDLLSSASVSRKLGDDYVECDDMMPEFESFGVPVNFDSPTITKRTLEGLYNSRPLVNLSSDPPKKYNVNTINDVHQLVTTMPGKPTDCSFLDDLQQYSASIMDNFGEFGLGIDSSFFTSDAIASSSNASSIQEINETPLTPSVEKYSLGKLSSRSGSGSEHMGSIPELECFRIDEGSSIVEEDEYQDRLHGSVDVDYSHQCPSGRKALQDISGLCQNNRNSVTLSTRCMDIGNKNLTADTSSSELNHHSNIRNGHNINKLKANHYSSVKREGNMSHSLHGRLDKPYILDNRNGSHMSESNVDKGSKPSNIVANVTSFIPLVKTKIQSTTCVKKDVKVKALKAAEAAKRLEEKKQKEQEMRKAAAKLERERLKQEKELKQKLEEEQKKKREVDLAAKKREREEVEKREIMKKRKCIDEVRKQQKQTMDRKRIAKDEKDASQPGNMELKKNLVDIGKNQVKPNSTEFALGCKADKCNNEKGVAVHERPLSSGSHAKENTLNSLEESYKMSPYKDSDEENDDDFEHEQESKRRRKFVPSWAWKENLDKILLSNMTLDPREIFAQKCSFNISDVLPGHIPA